VKVVVSHAYAVQNAGDAAILGVVLDDVHAAFPDAEVTVLTIGPTAPGETFDGVPVVPSLMFHALNRWSTRPLKLVYAVHVVTVTLLRAVVRRGTGLTLPVPRRLREVVRLYEQADAVVPVGGGYLRGRRGLTSTVELALLLHPLVLSRLLRTPVVLYTQSVGPFADRVQRWLAARVLRHVDLVLVREDISRDLLSRLGVRHNVVRAVDAGFRFTGATPAHLRERLGVPPGGLLVGITVRQWLPDQAQARFEEAVAEMADRVVERHAATVVFIPQVTSEHHHDDDRVVSRRVQRRMRRPAVVLDEAADHRAVRGLYSELDVLVGTRFHSVIFALTASVPALAVEYEHKTSGIMRDLGLGSWVVRMEDATADRLTERLEALLSQRALYRAGLRSRLPDQRQHAAEVRGWLTRAIAGPGSAAG
jgi:colanic acid/amylovoran biosynthesis protein